MSKSKSKKWKKINKSRKERPKLQDYKNWEELPPIPISLPIDGSIGSTGDWRTFRPVIKEGCNQCGICWMYCPEGVISRQEDGTFDIELEYCKGCGICAKECPSNSIEMIRESEINDG
ncbi:MAG: 4Fe-4S binding protein [Promethearchaeota archaeon]|jgi:2-oxoacid:acceptor oxidoreductase delta subunit (pyruvate/2-ketoisovalerate family)